MSLSKAFLVPSSLALLSGILYAQGACGNQNGIFMHRNLGILQRSFPNFGNPGGNVAGDAIWKIYPLDPGILYAAAPSIGGWVQPLVANNYTAPGTTNIPDVEFRTVVEDPTVPGLKTPDFASAAIATFVVGIITLPSGGNFTVTVSLGATGCATPVLQALPAADVAMVLLATAGEDNTTPNGARVFSTFQEDPVNALGSSGAHDAATMEEALYGAVHELRTEVGFFELTTMPRRDITATSFDFGARAYEPRLGDTLNFVSEGLQGIGRNCIFVFGASGTATPFCDPLGSSNCIQLTRDPITFALFGSGGTFGAYAAVGTGVFQDGVFTSGDFPLPIDPLLDGVDLWAACFGFDLATFSVFGASNTANVTLSAAASGPYNWKLGNVANSTDIRINAAAAGTVTVSNTGPDSVEVLINGAVAGTVTGGSSSAIGYAMGDTVRVRKVAGGMRKAEGTWDD